jgi:hypothetical protein
MKRVTALVALPVVARYVVAARLDSVLQSIDSDQESTFPDRQTYAQ